MGDSPPGGQMKLSRTVKAKLVALEPVRIAGPGRCPVEPGHQIQVVKNLTLTVDKIRVPKGGGWSLQYTLRDKRDLDKAHHLRSTPPVHQEDGKPPSASSIAQAREESSYTSRGDSMDAGHAPPVEWVDKNAKERRGAWEAQRGQRLKEQDIDREIRRLKHLRAKVRRGEDIDEEAA